MMNRTKHISQIRIHGVFLTGLMSLNKNKTKHIHTDTHRHRRKRTRETFVLCGMIAAVVASIGVVSLNDQMGMMLNTIRIHGPQSKAAYLETKTNPKTEKTAHHHHRL